MKINSVFGEEKIEMRDIIVTVLDHFYATCNSNPMPEMKMKNLSTWHLSLEDLSDKAIKAGFKAAVKENITKLPFPGQFRAMCIIPPKLEFYKAPPEIEHTPEEEEGLKKKRAEFFKRFKNNEILEDK